MKYFLSKPQIRQLQVYEYLEYARTWVDIETLMSSFRISRPTLLSDIDAINQLSDKFEIIIQDRKVKLSTSNIFSLVEIVNIFIHNNILFEIIRFLITHSDKSVYDLAKKINASPSATYRYIDQINELFQVNDLDIIIEKFPCHLAGDEQSLRYFILQYLKADIEFLKQTFISYQIIIEGILDKIYPHISDTPVDYGFSLNLKLLLLVNLLRLQQGFYLQSMNPESIYNKFIEIFLEDPDLISLSQKMNFLSWDSESIKQLLNPLFTSRLPLLNIKTQELLDNRNQITLDLLHEIKSIIHSFANDFDIPLPNPDRLTISIYNAVSIYDTFGRTYALIYNRFNIIKQSFEKKYIELYRYLWRKFESLSIQFFGHAHDELILSCIFALSIHWENLFFYINQLDVPIKILVINPLQPHSFDNLKDFLKLNLTNQIEIHACPIIFPQVSDLKEYEYDILISNTILPKEFGHNHLICLDMYNPYFIHELKAKIHQIRSNRYYEIIEHHGEILQD